MKSISSQSKTLAKFMISSTVLLFATSYQAQAFGNDETWVSGYGMGVAEAKITKGPGNEIYVTCDEGAGRNQTWISFMLGGDSSKGDSVQLIFDNQDPIDISISDGGISSNCRVCASNYDYVIERLKRHKTVHVKFQNGLSTRFSLKGASKAIGQCVADFYR
ncbi:hypothetical protein [Brucella anthropi]